MTVERVVKIQCPIGGDGPELYMVYDEDRSIDFLCEPTTKLRALFGPGIYKVYALAKLDERALTFEVIRLVEEQPW